MKNGIAAIIVAGLTLLTAPARGGIGEGTSSSGQLDTQAPEISVSMSPVAPLFLGSQTIDLTIMASDDHLSTVPGAHQVIVTNATEVFDTFVFDPGTGSDQVTWTVAETAAGGVHFLATAVDEYGNAGTAVSPSFTILPSVTGVPELSNALRVGSPRPNPFNPLVKLSADFPESGALEIAVFDARGRRVRELYRGVAAGGSIDIVWDGMADDGRRLPGGVYFVAFEHRIDGRVDRVHRKITYVP